MNIELIELFGDYGARALVLSGLTWFMSSIIVLALDELPWSYTENTFRSRAMAWLWCAFDWLRLVGLWLFFFAVLFCCLVIMAHVLAGGLSTWSFL
ncbi:hypothetical protein JT351_gp72 [Providencia phage vB_PreS-PibeRecoleta]|uniref:Transmembrane protein n=1 Tax=Providencia phage vB_PreS-PibeRecoleta TaxID=2761109 RepID=A0A7G5B105_9CAUD|nr:hypothetical protein JT351_gp72 [Providencia phage vB_PreS-PibeRecoleta]QMV29978.1 hypothetical protein [Providencia phage vB_PreS-PibeRecoleta]QND44249.1 hypothetical protein [Providencia phage vB_PreS-PatoteraRojo]